MNHLDFTARPRPKRGLTEAELAAIAAYDGPVTRCPPGGNGFTWKPFAGSAAALTTSDTGVKASHRKGGQ